MVDEKELLDEKQRSPQVEETESNEESQECPICVLSYGKRKVKVSCRYCGFEACTKCHQNFIFSKVEAQCMNCNKIWNEEFIATNFSNCFYNEYMKHLFQAFFELEKSLLPVTSQWIENKRREDEYQMVMNDVNSATWEIERIRRQVEFKRQNLELNKSLLTTNKYQYYELEFRLKELIQVLERQEKLHEKLLLKLDEFTDIKEKKFVPSQPCPKANCRGWINAKWQCNGCKSQICERCKEESSGQHKCDENLVKTISALEKDCRVCPSCKMRIFKISGCSQIFCTNCNTAFNWDTGQIEKGRIHNPHYFEWLEKQGKIREEKKTQGITEENLACLGANDISENLTRESTIFSSLVKFETCEHRDKFAQKYFETHEIDFEDKLMKNFRNDFSSYEKYEWLTKNYYVNRIRSTNRISDIYRNVIHLDETFLGHFDRQRIRAEPTEKYRALRVSYLKNEMNENEWRSTLVKQYKVDKFNMNMVNLNETYFNVISDLCRDFIQFLRDIEKQDASKMEDQLEIYVQFCKANYNFLLAAHGIREYFNENSYKIVKRYGYTKYTFITRDFINIYKDSIDSEADKEVISELDLLQRSIVEKGGKLDWMDDEEELVANFFLAVEAKQIDKKRDNRTTDLIEVVADEELNRLMDQIEVILRTRKQNKKRVSTFKAVYTWLNKNLRVAVYYFNFFSSDNKVKPITISTRFGVLHSVSVYKVLYFPSVSWLEDFDTLMNYNQQYCHPYNFLMANDQRYNLTSADMLVLGLDNIKTLRHLDVLRFNIERYGKSRREYKHLNLSNDILRSIVEKLEKFINEKEKENSARPLYTKTSFRMFKKFCEKILTRWLIW